ncbi:MAG TPA: M48 family metallopeptidase [Gammaproteobacteria bacterium]
MNEFTILFLIMLALTTGIEFWLSQRQHRHVHINRNEVPAPFRDNIPLEAHQKAADYSVAKIRYERMDLVASTFFLLCWTIGGGLELLDSVWRDLGLSPIITGIGVLLSVFFISGILDLPLSVFHTFVLEQRYGFNHTTPVIFIKDLIMQALIALIIGIPLIWVVLWLMGQSGQLWWLYVWMVWLGFSVFMMWAYPAVISPLFNKFSPLDDIALKDRIENLLTRTGFTSKGVFVMDSSRRSGHGNAYFTGLGAHKRIVFFDTLVKSLSHGEVEAVLAHELGHFKRHHIHKRIASMAVLSLLGLGILGWLIDQEWFYTGLGMQRLSDYAALALFMFAMPVFSFFISPIMTYVTRKQEFEADDYASEQADPQELIHALVKLYKENAATLTPDPLYSAFHDSHPPAPIRVAHLAAKQRRPV